MTPWPWNPIVLHCGRIHCFATNRRIWCMSFEASLKSKGKPRKRCGTLPPIMQKSFLGWNEQPRLLMSIWSIEKISPPEAYAVPTRMSDLCWFLRWMIAFGFIQISQKNPFGNQTKKCMLNLQSHHLPKILSPVKIDLIITA